MIYHHLKLLRNTVRMRKLIASHVDVRAKQQVNLIIHIVPSKKRQQAQQKCNYQVLTLLFFLFFFYFIFYRTYRGVETLQSVGAQKVCSTMLNIVT